MEKVLNIQIEIDTNKVVKVNESNKVIEVIRKFFNDQRASDLIENNFKGVVPCVESKNKKNIVGTITFI